MKFASGMIAGALLVLSNTSFAEQYFCISDEGKPKHCNKGDIILIKPTMVPRVCDFDAEILRMPTGESQADYLCRYTGTIMSVKELKSRNRPVPPQNKSMRPPEKRKNNKMFDSMPFFK